MTGIIPWVFAPKTAFEIKKLINRAWKDLSDIFPKDTTITDSIPNYVVYTRGNPLEVLRHPPCYTLVDQNNGTRIVMIHLLGGCITSIARVEQDQQNIVIDGSDRDVAITTVTWTVFALRDLAYRVRTRIADEDFNPIDSLLFKRCTSWAKWYVRKHKLPYLTKITMASLQLNRCFPIGFADMNPLIGFS